jgi:hypothetical protein
MPSLRHPKLAIAAFALLTAGCVAQTPSPANPQPVITSHASDSYAIYSLLLSTVVAGNPSPGGGGQHQMAIAATTVSADDMNPATEPDSELQPPPESENAFSQAVQDFQARRQERALLEHRLKLDRPYTLVSEHGVAEFGKSATAADSGLQGIADITRFSEVYFNTAQTAALVYTDSVCANPCANGQWIYLEKHDGQWVRRSSSTADRTDAYAIYSLLMPGVPFAGMSPAQAPHLAIAGTTVSIEQMNPAIAPDSELQPPPNNQEAFSEAVQDFHTRRYERIHLEPQLKLDRPYTLLSADDIAELRRTLAGIDPGSQLQSKWAGYPGITYFSEVYFNSAHTAALVYMNNFCANLCANGQWIYLEKKDDQWVRRSGLNI